MKPEYLDRLNAWRTEEIDALKAKGATDADLEDPAFASLVFKRLFEKHSDEIRADPDFAEAVFLKAFDKASPSQLREQAARYRAEGDHHTAYKLEAIADQRERGQWS
jgi:hypothetical protein